METESRPWWGALTGGVTSRGRGEGGGGEGSLSCHPLLTTAGHCPGFRKPFGVLLGSCGAPTSQIFGTTPPDSIVFSAIPGILSSIRGMNMSRFQRSKMPNFQKCWEAASFLRQNTRESLEILEIPGDSSAFLVFHKRLFREGLLISSCQQPVWRPYPISVSSVSSVQFSSVKFRAPYGTRIWRNP